MRRICDELQSTLKYRLFAKHQDGTTSLVGDGAFDPAVGRYVILPPLGGG